MHMTEHIAERLRSGLDRSVVDPREADRRTVARIERLMKYINLSILLLVTMPPI